MPDYQIMKAVEYDKLPVKFKKANPYAMMAANGYWLQKKYDGCFGQAIMRFNGGSQMLSRTGEDYTASCGHILEEIREAADSQSGSWDDFVVMGEVWRPFDEAKFPAISGQFRRHNPEPTLRFVANDLVPAGLLSTHSYKERYDDLMQLLPPEPNCLVTVAETYLPGSWSGDPLAYALEWKNAGGFDGAILRNPNAGYTVGLVKQGEIIKVKPVLSLDLRVSMFHVGQGEKTGRPVYTISVDYRGARTEVGSGIPHQLHQCPVVGQIVEVECLGTTEDGRLREPRFKGIRHDKLEPDA